ncbi:hypothetical protein R1flu_007787 [Riccia fluitans]|uniref:Uncharacterized protein n=1 Tax=Riccia fluitans TaxID=41844 RepID=A0ABD1Z0N8_9MARC
MIPSPKVQFLDVSSTSVAKTTPDVNIQTIGWEIVPTIAEEQPGSEARTSDPMPTLDSCCTTNVESGSEGWPSDSEWMVNQVTTRSKKRGKSSPKKPSISRGRRKESRPKKADKKVESNTLDSLLEAKSEEQNTYKDDISDLIRKALQDQTLTNAPIVPSAPTSKELPSVEVRPPVVFPSREEPRASALSRPVNSTSPITTTMEFDLMESLANMPAPISIL